MCCKGSIKQWRKDAISQQGALVFEWKKVHIEQLDKLSIIWHCIYFMLKVKRLTNVQQNIWTSLPDRAIWKSME